MRGVKLTLPIYTSGKKKSLLGMNWYAEAHYRSRNDEKKKYHLSVGKILPNRLKTLKSPIKTHYKVFYKNSQCDACNIIAVVDKFLMDALQEHNVIHEDNVLHYIRSTWEVVGQDRDNPRVEVEIKETKGLTCGK